MSNSAFVFVEQVGLFDGSETVTRAICARNQIYVLMGSMGFGKIKLDGDWSLIPLRHTEFSREKTLLLGNWMISQEKNMILLQEAHSAVLGLDLSAKFQMILLFKFISYCDK